MRNRLTKQQILTYLKKLKVDLENDGISKVGLFGSYAKDEAHIGSDIDIVINTTDTFKKKYPNFQAFIYLEELRNKLQKKFGNSIDLCDEVGLKNRDILKGVIYV